MQEAHYSSMWVSMQFISAATRGQQSISTVLLCAWGGSAHSLVINVLVMSHEEGVGGGWGREIKREEKERGRGGEGGGRAACITSRCPLKLPGG